MINVIIFVGSAIEIVLRPIAQRLDAVQVRAKVTGVIGIVTDRRGTPMPGVEVALLGARAPVTTDSTGAFALLDVPPGAYLLRARERMHERAREEVHARVDVGSVFFGFGAEYFWLFIHEMTDKAYRVTTCVHERAASEVIAKTNIGWNGK